MLMKFDDRFCTCYCPSWWAYYGIACGDCHPQLLYSLQLELFMSDFYPDCQKCWRRGITVSVVFVNSQICAMFSAMFNPPPPPKESKLSSKLLLYSLIIFCNWWIYAFAVWPWHVLASCMIDHCQYGLCNMIPFLNFATLCTCICEWV